MSSDLIHKGILTTPNLWLASSIYDIEQYEISINSFSFKYISEKLRLGMYVEQTIFQALENQPEITVLEKNIQIIENNITLGEIDCLLSEGESYIHLEIVYKFYLCDDRISGNQLNCWIGPNRKDSLIEKLNKLRDKQFPLLHHKRTKEVLKQTELNSDQFKQKVCFKAQLYIPINSPKKKYDSINPECIIGYYYRFSELTTLKNAKFHIPNKLNWVSTPKENIDWMNFESFSIEIELLINEKRSPLCFVKDKKGNLSKIFVVWWD